jgi:SAM-dependent methyltransferase
MKINFIDKLKVLFEVYKCIPLLPLKYKIFIMIKPLEATRYVEFAYILKYLGRHNFKFNNILDVSSPFVISYYFSKKSKVLKTDISHEEKKYFRSKYNPKFKIEDATKLSFDDNIFDFTFSVSALEHIYKNTNQAINEIIRVTKKGGLIYLSIPVSKEMTEEWLETDIYTNQYKQGEKIFFQYRFSQDEINNILYDNENVEIINSAVFWERKNGTYDKMVGLLRNRVKSLILNFIREALINIYYGFTIFENNSKNFEHAKSFGNLSIILKKK